MDISHFIDALISVQTPALPDVLTLRAARYLSWALVLASLVMWLGQRLPIRWQRGLGVVVFLWTVIPSSVSPAYWLALAFQMPSLTSVVLAATALVLLWRKQALVLTTWMADVHARRAGEVAVVLGWLLLLDTFALLPQSLYAQGFSVLLLGACALVSVLSWMLWGADPGARRLSLLLVAVLSVHVLLRLPTGNVWDAVLDPLIWLLLQLAWLQRAGRSLSAWLRSLKATRA